MVRSQPMTTYTGSIGSSTLAGTQYTGTINSMGARTVAGTQYTQTLPMQTIQAPYQAYGGSPVTTVVASSANLLQSGRVVSERVVPVEEGYSSGLVRMGAEAQTIETVVQPAVVETVEVAPGVVETVVVQPEIVQTVGVEAEQQVEGQEQQAMGPPRVVIVCTSASSLGDQPTGAWSEEITGPYYVFLDAGCEVYIASVNGGQVPIDQGSLSENFFTENDRRFQEENGLQALENSLAIGDVSPDAIDCVWLAGGHGTCMDFEASLAQFVTDAIALGRPVGAVCHGVIGLLSAVSQDGQPLLAGKQVTGFSNAEEDAVGLMEKVPFLVQQRMEEQGAAYSCGEPWTEYAVRDGLIITGQNPQSSVRTAQLCVEALMPPY